LVLAIGVGSFLISTLYFSKDLLLVQANMEAQENTANIILLDVQTGQQEDVAKTIKANNHQVIDNIPIVTMRMYSIGGKLVNAIKEDSTSTINRWVLNHEFRTTYRDKLIDSETLEQGEFTAKAEGLEVIPISVSDNLAKDAEVAIGDEIVFNVQGVLIKTVVGSIRTVDWSRMQLNFTVLFPTGVLESAPQFRVLTTQVPDEKASATLQQQLVSQFPNISVLDLRQILSVIENLLNKIGWIINFMAFFSILTGIIVLLGAVRTSKHQRIKESVLMRTIGAKSRQILKMIALEYFYLGILGSLTGIILSLVSSQLLALWIFETPFSPSLIPFVVLFPGITILVLVIGLTNNLSVIKKPPLQVLRKETI
jgi:putative ABC transport system permease protein